MATQWPTPTRAAEIVGCSIDDLVRTEGRD